MLDAQTNPPLHHVYIDGFSGPGVHLARRTGEFVPGSPLNALWRNPEKVDPHDVSRMTSFWGDESWRDVAYQEDDQLRLFGSPDLKKAPNYEVAYAFRERLKELAGFEFVREPLPMLNSKGAVVYYLFFGSQKKVADKIVQHIFKKYQSRVK